MAGVREISRYSKVVSWMNLRSARTVWSSPGRALNDVSNKLISISLRPSTFDAQARLSSAVVKMGLTGAALTAGFMIADYVFGPIFGSFANALNDIHWGLTLMLPAYLTLNRANFFRRSLLAKDIVKNADPKEIASSVSNIKMRSFLKLRAVPAAARERIAKAEKPPVDTEEIEFLAQTMRKADETPSAEVAAAARPQPAPAAKTPPRPATPAKKVEPKPAAAAPRIEFTAEAVAKAIKNASTLAAMPLDDKADTTASASPRVTAIRKEIETTKNTLRDKQRELRQAVQEMESEIALAGSSFGAAIKEDMALQLKYGEFLKLFEETQNLRTTIEEQRQSLQKIVNETSNPELMHKNLSEWHASLSTAIASLFNNTLITSEQNAWAQEMLKKAFTAMGVAKENPLIADGLLHQAEGYLAEVQRGAKNPNLMPQGGQPGFTPQPPGSHNLFASPFPQPGAPGLFSSGAPDGKERTRTVVKEAPAGDKTRVEGTKKGQPEEFDSSVGGFLPFEAVAPGDLELEEPVPGKPDDRTAPPAEGTKDKPLGGLDALRKLQDVDEDDE